MVFDTIGKKKITNKLEGRTGTWSEFRNKLFIKVSWDFHLLGKRAWEDLGINID